jgi:hypothetical protein
MIILLQIALIWLAASIFIGIPLWMVVKIRDRREEAILADCEREAIRSGRQSPIPTQLRPRSLPPISASAFKIQRGM